MRDRTPPATGAQPFVLVIGDPARLDDDEGAVSQLRQLGAEVRPLAFWEEPASVLTPQAPARAIVIEAGGRPDLATLALRAVRRERALEGAPSLVALEASQVARLEPSSGFDDFILVPFVPAELYARVRALEWKKSEFLTEERVKVGSLVIDRAAHEAVLEGRRVPLTAKEFALLAFLASNRGRVFSREALLTRVWGGRYEGGARTVDIHVTRLRAKLGAALPLETLRGSGYKLRSPGDLPGDDEAPRLARIRDARHASARTHRRAGAR